MKALPLEPLDPVMVEQCGRFWRRPGCGWTSQLPEGCPDTDPSLDPNSTLVIDGAVRLDESWIGFVCCCKARVEPLRSVKPKTAR